MAKRSKAERRARRKKTAKDIVDGLKEVNKVLRKTKAISTVSGELAKAGVPYAQNVSNVSRQFGYGYDPYHPVSQSHEAKKPSSKGFKF